MLGLNIDFFDRGSSVQNNLFKEVQEVVTLGNVPIARLTGSQHGTERLATMQVKDKALLWYWIETVHEG